MSSEYSISEDLSIEHSIVESIQGSYVEEILTQKISNTALENPTDIQEKFLKKKLLHLKRKNVVENLPKYPQVRSSMLAAKIDLLKKPQKAVRDEFYSKPADEFMVSKLKFENMLEDIKADANYHDIEEENKQLREKYEEIEKKKFIDAQYYRIMSKKL